MTKTSAKAPPARLRDAEKTKGKIMRAATREFGMHGFSGARIERIAKSAKCNIRLLYHYYGNKKALYLAVLEGAYADLRHKEARLAYDLSDPLGCMEMLLRFTFDYFERNPCFEGLLRTENMMRGKFVAQSAAVPEAAAKLKEKLRNILRIGEEMGQIRPGIDAVQLYVTITALSRFHLANSYSLGALLNTDLRAEQWRTERLDHCVHLLRAWLTQADDSGQNALLLAKAG